MSAYSIDQFEFISLSRPFTGPAEQLEREARPGADGVTFWRTGKRGEQIVLRSAKECADVPAALDLLRDYRALIGADPVTASWAAVALADLKVIVFDVQPEEHGLKALLIGIGGVSGSGLAMLRCQWLVEVIDTTVED